MMLVLYLALLLCVSTHCDDAPTDEELEAAFQEIEDALSYTKDIQAVIQEVKDTVTAKPNYKTNALGMAKALSTAVPKLKSGDGYTIAQGALTLAAGVAENLPGGMVFASLATLVASVIGLIDSDKTDKIRDTMTKVLEESRDKDLEDKVDSFKGRINTLMTAMRSLTHEDITDHAPTAIATKVEHASTVGVLPLLKKRINEYRKSEDPEVAKRAFSFSVMYGQLVTLEDLALTQVIILLKRDHPGMANIYVNTKNTVIQGSRDDLSFWNSPKVEHAGALVYYYPLGSSEKGMLLRSFLQRLKVPEPEPWNPAKYVLMSVKWPTYYLYFTLVKETSYTGPPEIAYLSYNNGSPMRKDKIVFRPVSNGYFTLRSMAGEDGREGRYGGYANLGFDRNPYYVYGDDRHTSEEERYHFIVISYPGTDIITISCRNWPHKFFSGEKNKYSVILKDGNIGSDIRFYTNPCLRKVPGEGSYKCPHYTPKKG